MMKGPFERCGKTSQHGIEVGDLGGSIPARRNRDAKACVFGEHQGGQRGWSRVHWGSGGSQGPRDLCGPWCGLWILF